MNRILIAGAFAVAASAQAFAADLPPMAPPPPPPRAPAMYVPVVPAFTWTGFYVGGNVGWGWTNANLTDTGPGFPPGFGQIFPLGSVTNLTQNGFLGGGQIGFNYQFGQLVAGLEADFDYTAIKNSQTAAGFGAGAYTDPWTGTVAARLGWAFDRALVYGKGGGAWMQEKYNVTAPDGSAATGTFNRLGFVVGAGFEYAVWDFVTFKVEYNYLNFGSQSQTLTPNATDLVTGTISGDANKSQLSASVVKVGVNFLFH
jgi:outer membrane immunogenic protein